MNLVTLLQKYVKGTTNYTGLLTCDVKLAPFLKHGRPQAALFNGVMGGNSSGNLSRDISVSYSDYATD
jgi:hypothetical protein